MVFFIMCGLQLNIHGKYSASLNKNNLIKLEDYYLTIEGKKVEVIMDNLHQFRNINAVKY
jgi:hypothetical protein